MTTLSICATDIHFGTEVIGPDNKNYVVTDARNVDGIQEYELALLSGQWSNWFPITDIVSIVPKKVN